MRFVGRNKGLLVLAAIVLMLLGAAGGLVLRAVFERESERHVALLFSDRELLDSLTRRADQLWPTSSRVAPEIDTWLVDAHRLVGSLDEHRSTRAELADGARRSVVVSTLGKARLLEQADDLIRDIARFAAPDGQLDEMERRRARATTLWIRTVTDHRAAWHAAAERVRGDQRFEGLELPPQEGLIPLGPDPHSRLEEFAVDGTGAVPVRIAPDASLRPAIGDALVLVLIPGGSRWIGGQWTDPGGRNFAERATNIEGHEGPPFRVDLDPFLLAKFECTQDQWLRWTGVNTSDWEVGGEFHGRTIGPLNPVESLSWEQARVWLPRFGLCLPTEAQWEFAARGNSPWCLVHGRTARDLAGFVNANTYQRDHPSYDPEFPDDGHWAHMPVGSQRPNGFGLHDVLGNVWELCRDTYKVDYHELRHRAGDGLVVALPDGDVTRRGGSADQPPACLHVYLRQVKRFDGRDALTGLRPARALITSESEEARPKASSSNDSPAKR